MVDKEHLTGSPVTIEIVIDELVLYGFAPADRYRLGTEHLIREALTGELTRLFTERGTNGKPSLWATAGKPVLGATARSGGTLPGLDQSFELAHLNAGSFQMTQDAPPERIGTQVAGALWESVAQRTSGVAQRTSGVAQRTSGVAQRTSGVTRGAGCSVSEPRIIKRY